MRARAPVTDTIIYAIAGLVDDSQTERRDPSHSDLEFQIRRCGLEPGDPNLQGQTVGKEKRVRATLSWALEFEQEGAEHFAAALVSLIRAKGGFRSDSPNYVGDEATKNAIEAFRAEGFILTTDGDLRASSIDTLSGVELTDALEGYARRARRGAEDAALLVGTAKDLLEATAAHVVTERFGAYPQHSNFPTLLGQAFVALGLATTQSPPTPGEAPECRLERALYETGCAINSLRNKQGTGHGRPWLPTVSDEQARSATQLIGAISGLLLAVHKAKA